MHALEEYGLMHVKLYEDIARHGHIATTYAYPVKVEGRYVMDPSPIPKFDNPKMHMSPALQLFGAGREKRIYAVPPYTAVVSLDFEDHPFEVQRFDEPCALCGATGVYLDEVILDDRGGRMFVCSDTDHCESAATDAERAGVSERRRSCVADGVTQALRRADRLPRRRASTLWPGEVLAVVGESGSGKTTLLNCLSARLPPSTGSIRYRMRDGDAPRPLRASAKPSAAS